MALLFDVVARITLPIVAIAALGFVMQTRARFDVRSLNRLLLYATLPCFLVVTLAEAELPLAQLRGVVIFTVVQFAVLLGLGWAVGRALGLEAKARAVVAVACAFPNSGNFGIPVIELAFGSDYVVHQAVITSTHTVLILLLAPVLFGGGGTVGQHLKGVFQTPLIPALAVGIGLNLAGIELIAPVRKPLETMGDAYVGVALFALGAQLADNRLRVPLGAAGLSVALRLLLGPLLTGAALLVLDLPARVEAILLVGSAAPVGVLLTIFASEFRGNVELSSAVVVTSTVLSPVMITAAVIATRLMGAG
jgi:predicted permease